MWENCLSGSTRARARPYGRPVATLLSLWFFYGTASTVTEARAEYTQGDITNDSDDLEREINHREAVLEVNKLIENQP